MPEEIQVEKTTTEVGVTKFGLDQIKKDNTPKWATWTFSVVLYVLSLVTIICTIEPAIPAHVVVIIARYSSLLLLVVHGLSKMLGVDISKDEQDAKDAFQIKK